LKINLLYEQKVSYSKSMPKGAVTKLANLEVFPSPQQEFQPTALSQLKDAEPTELSA
jgi:hypothetical protein